MGMSAAKQQLSRLLRFVPMPAATGTKAMTRLMTVYHDRPDLQEVFPEAADGNLNRLINWAAGVSTKQWTDSSFAALAPSALWYCANRKTAEQLVAPLPWREAIATSEQSGNPLAVTLKVAQDPKSNDISNHLLTMA